MWKLLFFYLNLGKQDKTDDYIYGQALAWLKSSLLDHYDFVWVKEQTSDLTVVKYGMPQGSVLGPLPF